MNVVSMDPALRRTAVSAPIHPAVGTPPPEPPRDDMAAVMAHRRGDGAIGRRERRRQ